MNPSLLVAPPPRAASPVLQSALASRAVSVPVRTVIVGTLACPGGPCGP
jgi:hypothetical protein